ncbi:diphthine--ammonia ligase [Leeuwenhoekiella sp. NPDC079379]|uniref:Dph6-related ATP pyrophosphatase n=1 Tax=Leeuwenhoekiella sp. NPDC079379 TaxID=3364122 RepID=UPI0037C86F63
MKQAYFNWSSGKDSAFALYNMLEQQEYKITKLVTTVNSDVDRVSMHGLREVLLDLQAESLGLPLEKILLSGNVSMSEYSKILGDAAEVLKAAGNTHSIFGDIFLEDLKAYREEQLQKAGLKAVFPLWKQNTTELIHNFIDLSFKAITVCVNANLLNESFVGRVIDKQFIKDLPAGVDPCGENGEFHTFVYDGPIFKSPINFSIGEKVLRGYEPLESDDDNCFSDDQKHWDTKFWFCDLIPV